MQFPFNLRSSSPLFVFLSIVICRTDFHSFYVNQLGNLPSYFLIKLLSEKTVITCSSLTAWVRSCSVDFQCGLLPLSPSRTTPNLKERKKRVRTNELHTSSYPKLRSLQGDREQSGGWGDPQRCPCRAPSF